MPGSKPPRRADAGRVTALGGRPRISEGTAAGIVIVNVDLAKGNTQKSRYRPWEGAASPKVSGQRVVANRVCGVVREVFSRAFGGG